MTIATPLVLVNNSEFFLMTSLIVIVVERHIIDSFMISKLFCHNFDVAFKLVNPVGKQKLSHYDKILSHQLRLEPMTSCCTIFGWYLISLYIWKKA